MSTIISNSNPKLGNQKKSIGKHYKLNLTCVICNGIAHGFNFGSIACESCKAFFRRNGLKPLEKLRCYGHGNCNTRFDQRKRCKKCRLEKCFRTGMRKDLILTTKEKQERRQRIEHNRRSKKKFANNQENSEPTQSLDDSQQNSESIQCLDDNQQNSEPIQNLGDNQQNSESIQSLDDNQQTSEPTQSLDDNQHNSEPTQSLHDNQQNSESTKSLDDNQQNEDMDIELLTNDHISEEIIDISQSPINEICLIEDHWSKLDFLQNAYIKAVKLNQLIGLLQYPAIQSIETTLELFSIPIYISSIRLITYFKQIFEFQQLNQDEQVYLIKLNLLTIVFLHSIFIYDNKHKIYHEQNTNDPIFLEKDWINTINNEFDHEMKEIQNNLVNIIQSDNKIIKLFFLILLFSNDLSSNCSIMNINTLNIFKAQNIYNELLYKYCLNQYGLDRTVKIILQLTFNTMKIQKLITELKYTINDYMDLTQLPILMQSLF